MTDSKKASIVAKIKALLAKTRDNGCTEAEAEAAAILASKLMQEYDIELKDTQDIEQDKYGKRERDFAGGSWRRRSFHEVINTVGCIAYYFDCKVWYNTKLIYFGSKDDTEMSHEMTDMIRQAMDNAWEQNKEMVHSENPHIHGRALRSSFLLGMSRRLNEKFFELKTERTAIANQRVTGTSLVVIKNQIVEQKYNAFLQSAGIKLGKGVAKKATVNTAFQRGKQAADRIDINRKLH